MRDPSVMFAVIVVVAAVALLILREVVTWYFKLNRIVELQEQILEELKRRN